MGQAPRTEQITLATGVCGDGFRTIEAVIVGNTVHDYRVRVHDDRGNVTWRPRQYPGTLDGLRDAMTAYETGFDTREDDDR